MLWVAAHKFGPSGFSIVRGNLVSGGLPELQGSDDQRLSVRNGLVLSSTEPPINVVFEAVSPFAKVADLKLRLEASVSTPGLEQIVDLFDHIGNAWSTVDTRTATFGSDGVAVITLPDHNRFINPTTRVMQARVRYRRAGLTLSSTWVAGFDQVRWELDPS
jgi:hypothetical protein